jgi:hypothetical protein
VKHNVQLVLERQSAMNSSPDVNQPDYQAEFQHRKVSVPARSREHKWTRSSRKSARRKSNSTQTNQAKSGMHRRRNRRMSW